MSLHRVSDSEKGHHGDLSMLGKARWRTEEKPKPCMPTTRQRWKLKLYIPSYVLSFPPFFLSSHLDSSWQSHITVFDWSAVPTELKEAAGILDKRLVAEDIAKIPVISKKEIEISVGMPGEARA